MTTIHTARWLEPHCVWGDESESQEAVCAAAKKHEADNSGHKTHLHGRYERGEKKPYRTPELIEYGNVRQLTAGVG